MRELLDGILNRDKKKSFYPTNDQDLEEEATNMPEIPVTKASDQDNKQPAEMVQPQQEATPVPTNKWGYSQSEMDALSKAGYTPDRLEYFLSDFDPAKGENFLQRIYGASVHKPIAPDEKQLKRARLLGSIGDSLDLLSQMWSAGKGAHIKERDYKNSASAQIAEKEKNLRALYLQQQNKYNDGMYNAQLKDLLKSLDDHNNGKKGIQGVVAAQKKFDQAQAQFEDKQRFAYDKLAQDQQNKDTDRKIKEDNQKNLDHHRKAMKAQGWSRVADSKNRTSAYVKKMSSSGTGKNSNYQMIFGANPNDKDVQTDNFGNNVKVFEMNKGQIDQYAREALSDPKFMARHQDLIIQKPDMLGSGSYKYKPNQDIAAAYLQEQYENSFTSSPAIPLTATPPITNRVQLPNWMPSYNIDEEGTTPEEVDEWGEFAIE